MNLSNLIAAHENIVQIALYTSIICACWIAESLIATGGARAKWQHSLTNIGFIFTALPIQLLFTTFIVATSVWVTKNHWGLIYMVPFWKMRWWYFVCLLVLLDLCEYCYHVIMHKFDFLWRFHLVHHSDLKVDVSTTVREHPGESIVRTCFSILWVFLLGPAVSVLLIRQTFQSASNILAHTEFRLPHKVNRIVGLIFITPNLHHVHHHYQLPYTDCNYGDILSVWDRLFGTYTELDRDDTVFGLDTHMNAENSSKFLKVMEMPFRKIVRPGIAVNQTQAFINEEIS